MNKLKMFLNRHWSFVITDWRIYVPFLIGTLIFSIWLSLYCSSWLWISRYGSLLVIVGAIIGLRRHFRLGSKNAEEPVPPLVTDRQLNPAGFNETMFREGDLELQSKGLKLAVFGTFIWGYGDALLDLLLPLTVNV